MHISGTVHDKIRMNLKGLRLYCVTLDSVGVDSVNVSAALL
jgi:hypothetical protein